MVSRRSRSLSISTLVKPIPLAARGMVRLRRVRWPALLVSSGSVGIGAAIVGAVAGVDEIGAVACVAGAGAAAVEALRAGDVAGGAGGDVEAPATDHSALDARGIGAWIEEAGGYGVKRERHTHAAGFIFFSPCWS
ncbi:hypothetical protein ON010_g19066 [Phytophthora cinnamomi]|nr:hypothetical protein ON010_g19066 [Phytophthora cinnamomi]